MGIGRGWATPRAALVAALLAGLLVAGATVAVFLIGTTAPIKDTTITLDSLSVGPLDDYGLRHPNTFGQSVSTAARGDDYGLRHPNTFGQSVSTAARGDDYGLRHPNP